MCKRQVLKRVGKQNEEREGLGESLCHLTRGDDILYISISVVQSLTMVTMLSAP